MTWRQVVGYEGTYEVSEFGDVRRVVYYDRRERDPGLLRPAPNTDGYLHVALVLKGKSRITPIHKIVADAFLGTLPRKKERNHRDGNKLNNHFTNLEYISHRDNIRHARSLGLYPIGEATGASSLTEAQVRQIRCMWIPRKKGHGPVSIARKFGVHPTTIYAILIGRTWKHVKITSTT